MIKTQNSNIFGGLTLADWSGQGSRSDSNAFLYSLVNSYNISVKMNFTQTENAIDCSPSNGVAFGNVRDLSCSCDQCNSYLGFSYKLPSFLSYGSDEPYSFLGGSRFFQAVEIETYWIDRIK